MHHKDRLFADQQEAERRHVELLERSEQVFGVSPRFALHLNNVASFHKDRGDPLTAEPLQRQALEMDRQVLGDVHPYVVQDRINLAEALRLQGAFAAARAQLDSADSAAETGAGQGMDVGPMLRAEAGIVSGRVRIAEGAREVGPGEMRAALEILRRAHPEGGSQEAWARVVLGAHLLEEGVPGVETGDEGETLLRSGHAELLEAQGPHSPRVRQAERWLQAAGLGGG